MAAGDFHNFDNQDNVKSAEWDPLPVSVKYYVDQVFICDFCEISPGWFASKLPKARSQFPPFFK